MAEEAGESGGEAQVASSTESAAIAAALDLASRDPALSGHVAGFLDAQRALTETQRHHLHLQTPRLKLGIVGDLVRVALQGAALLALLLVVVQVGLIVRDATNDYGLNIETISVPPSLAQRGFSGTTVAEAMRARLEQIRGIANGHSAGVSDDVHGGRQETLKVEIPETGLSIDQVESFIHAYFGHARTLSGAIVDLGGGKLELHVHVTGTDPVAIDGSADDIDGLLQRGAEAAFANFDPTNNIQYLDAQGREDEALTEARQNIRLAHDQLNLADLVALSGDIDGDPVTMRAQGTAAVALDPRFWAGWADIANADAQMGHDEAALAAFRRLSMLRTEDQPRGHQSNFPRLAWQAHFVVATMTGDFADALRRVSSPPPDMRSKRVAMAIRVEALARVHACAPAADARAMAIAVRATGPAGIASDDRLIARCRGDFDAALAADHQIIAIDTDSASLAAGHQRARGAARWALATTDRPALAEDLIDAGRPREAIPLLRQTPNDCYYCERVRGRVDAALGDARNADIRFARAIRQAPSLPFAYTDWAAAKLARHDASGALKLADAAIRRSPGYPDASALKGDIEAALGNAPAARAAYRRALDLAPLWQDVKQKLARLPV